MENMQSKIYPARLRQGDSIAIIAPSRSFSILSEETISIANSRLKNLGLTPVFGKHIKERDEFVSSSIASRIDDFHWAFRDKDIKGILTVIGGFNSNQLLPYINWKIIHDNPKVLCGYSDISALNNAIFSQTGLVTYSGPHYSSFGQLLNFDYTFDHFRRCLFTDEPFEVTSSEQWSDDAWYLNQNDCNLVANEGSYVICEGEADETIIGANLCTFRTLQGTPYFPDLTDVILFLEEDYESKPHHFDRDLQSLLLMKDFNKVKGIVFGRFQRSSGMTKELLHKIIAPKRELNNIPIIAGVDFGHTSPMITFPIGGTVRIKACGNRVEIIITHQENPRKSKNFLQIFMVVCFRLLL
jgi:muramoyltetrapeptide carboxypeptidase